MSIKKLLAIAALLFLVCIPAHAKLRLAVINTGDELFEVGDFPAEIVAPGASSHAKAGFKCSHFGLFWADAWTWDCKLVAITGENSYADLPEQIATKLAIDPRFDIQHAKRGFWNHYAFWCIIGAFALFAFFSKRTN